MVELPVDVEVALDGTLEVDEDVEAMEVVLVLELATAVVDAAEDGDVVVEVEVEVVVVGAEAAAELLRPTGNVVAAATSILHPNFSTWSSPATECPNSHGPCDRGVIDVQPGIRRVLRGIPRVLVTDLDEVVAHFQTGCCEE